jgi:hypothetical protein
VLAEGRASAGFAEGLHREVLQRAKHLDNDSCHDDAEDNEFGLERHSNLALLVS